ncbi:MAG TPA: hypothetical protein VES36_01515 [Candidatus Limnocylindrales bacterium]|nr:hypothetical protein [Candidatus Limnocylindrales bacterium]
MDASEWDGRMTRLWASIDGLPEDEFLAGMQRLVAELPDDDPIGPFARASAFDSTGHSGS